MNFIIVSSCFILIVNADLGPIKQYPACSNNGVAGEQKLFQCKEKCPSDWTFIKDEAKSKIPQVIYIFN